MPIDHQKRARLTRLRDELVGAKEVPLSEVHFLRHGTVSADGTRLLERAPISAVRARFNRESPFDLPFSRLPELRQLVADAEVHFRDVDSRRLTIAQGDMLTDLRLAQQLVILYERLSAAEAHAAEIQARLAPVAQLVARLDEYVGSRDTHGLVQSLGVTHV